MNQHKFIAEIIQKTTAEIRTFLSQLAYKTSGYKSLHNLTEQVEHQYNGRFLIELIQNAHDAMNELPEVNNKGRLEILVSQDEQPYGALYVANDGLPFIRSNFESLSQLGQSDKDPQKSIGNKGIGFRSVLEICNSPEIYSRSSKDSEGFDGYCFSFDPYVTRQFEKPILDLIKGNDKPLSPLDHTLPLIEWGAEQLLSFRELYDGKDPKWLREEMKYLSPYLLPIPINASTKTAAIKSFEKQALASVIRLPFKSLSAQTLAIEMVDELDENTVLFLDRVKFLSLNSGKKMRLVERKLDYLNDPNNGQEIKMEVIEDDAEGYIKKKYWLWSANIGGEDNEEEREEIAKAIAEDELPGRWSEVNRASVSLAVGMNQEPEQGRINIYLPTQLPTGCATHFNGPFYGDMSRTVINFKKIYNTLLLKRIGQLAVDIIIDNLAGKDVKQAKAILDILAPSQLETQAGNEWFEVIKEVCEQKGINLSDQAIILAEKEWTSIGYTSLIPEIDTPNVLTPEVMRKHAIFDVIHKDLMGRKSEIISLFKIFGVDSRPLDQALANTVEVIASELHKTGGNADWNGFWYDLIKLFKNNSEPLKGRKILLGSDLDLHASDQNCTIFFPPRQGIDDDEIQVEGSLSNIPHTLRIYIAFLSDRIEIYDPEDARQQTPIRKYLESTLVERYRVMEIIRSVLIPKIPQLPATLKSAESRICQDILLWGLKLVTGMPDRGKGRRGTLKLLQSLPVPCHDGWYPINQSSFGPGWSDTAGTDVFEYLRGANTTECKEALGKMLLPPTDNLWDGNGTIYKDLLELSGVFDGLQLISLDPSDWESTTTASKSSYKLPDVSPACIPDNLWKEYKEKYSPIIRDCMAYSGFFSYTVQSLSIIPGLDHYSGFNENTRTNLMNSLFASIHKWEESWLKVYIKKVDGLSQNIDIESPLVYCLKSLPWIVTDSDGTRKCESPSQRWYVPKIHLAGNRWQYAHLKPLPGLLADKIDRNPDLFDNGLAHLNMPKFDPDPEERSSDTRLLDDLALALTEDIPNYNFFINHIYVAWSNYENYGEDFPDKIIVSKGPKQLKAVKPDVNFPIYLPDSSESFINELDLFSLPVIVINTTDAKRLSQAFKEKYGAAVRLASEMRVWPIVNGQSWQAEKGILLSESELDWLPPVILTLYAFVGTPPPGLYAKKLTGFVQLLRNITITWVSPLKAGLWMGDEIIADPSAAAMWISQDRVLVCDSEYKEQISKYAEALKNLLNRDDLELPLKHVLEKLEDIESSTREDVYKTIESLKIKPTQYDQVFDKWQGDIGSIIRMTIPVIALLKPEAELGMVADIENEESLIDYLQKYGPAQPNPQELLRLIRSCDGYFTLGEKLFQLFPETAQLDKWNTILASLDETTVEISKNKEQFQQHLDSVRKPFRAVIRRILRDNPSAVLFVDLEDHLHDLSCPGDWLRRFWIVEFQMTMKEVEPRLREIGALEDEISIIINAKSVDDLVSGLSDLGLEPQVDPLNIHSDNIVTFHKVLSKLQKIAICWCENSRVSPLMWEGGIDVLMGQFKDYLDVHAFLDDWDESECIRVFLNLQDKNVYPGFWKVVDGANSIAELMGLLGITEQDLLHADESLKRQREQEEKEKRMVDVCGQPFENAANNLANLWNHLDRGFKDKDFSDLDMATWPDLKEQKVQKKKHTGKKKSGRKRGSPPKRMTQAMKNLAGLAGEILVYRLLQKTFGEDVISPDCWISENSKHKFPQNRTDDSYGCDFELSVDGKKHFIEVKASTGEDEFFELGSSEIQLAVELANKRNDIFSIIHVMNVLSDNPEFQRLPNPYSKRYRAMYKIEDAGLRIRYETKSENPNKS